MHKKYLSLWGRLLFAFTIVFLCVLPDSVALGVTMRWSRQQEPSLQQSTKQGHPSFFLWGYLKHMFLGKRFRKQHLCWDHLGGSLLCSKKRKSYRGDLVVWGSDNRTLGKLMCKGGRAEGRREHEGLNQPPPTRSHLPWAVLEERSTEVPSPPTWSTLRLVA